MLYFIQDTANSLLTYVKDDPVRPEIPVEFRVSNGRLIAALVDNEKPAAMVCVSFHDFIPRTVDDLLQYSTNPTTAIFYTIWSYSPGAGVKLLRETVSRLKETYPTITRFVTLSPKTEMARKFHLRNGALIFQENETTVNYEYCM